MTRYTEGNLLEAEAEAFVNTVNEVGVMGKGVALMFSEKFPTMSRQYQHAAKKGQIHVGQMYVTEVDALFGPRWIIHFPTKKHWRHPSKLAWIRDGLRDLVRVIHEHGIASVALPPLGCGNGGLDWDVVRREIEWAFDAIPKVECIVYKPTAIYYNALKAEGVESLTVPRALIAELIRRYEILGLGCTNLEVQKLAWFINRWIDACGLENSLDLKFVANKYGPYADQLKHLLDKMNGSYLHCERRLADAGPGDLIWFDNARRGEVTKYLTEPWAVQYREPLEKTSHLIAGFESPLGMELLATVDWLITVERSETTVTHLQQRLVQWPVSRAAARRKQRIFSDGRMLQAAVDRLTTCGPPQGSDVTHTVTSPRRTRARL